MSNTDTLSELLGIPEELTVSDAMVPRRDEDVSSTPVVQGELVTPNAPNKDEQELDEDIQTVRTTLRELSAKASKAADAAILMAEAGDSAKAFEAVAKMTEAIVAANKELIEIHRTRKEAKKPVKGSKESLLPQGDQKPINIEKAVFVGRASDLLRELRQMDKDQKALTENAETS